MTPPATLSLKKQLLIVAAEGAGGAGEQTGVVLDGTANAEVARAAGQPGCW